MPSVRLTIPLLQALETEVPVLCAGKTLTLAGVDYTPAEFAAVAARLKARIATLAAARDAVKAAMLALDAAMDDEGVTVREGRDLLGVMFHRVPASLTALALPARKVPAPRTSAENAEAALKAAATRKARGTMSKKQKAAITGNVTGVTITPVRASAAPVATSPEFLPAEPGARVSPAPGGAGTADG